MSEGLTDKQGSNKQFFKLKQDKRDGSKTLKQFRFFQQEKVNGNWASTNEGNSMAGILKELNTKSYVYEGETKENLEVTLQGADTDYVIGFGFNTGITENLLNSLANEPIIGTVEMNCGQINKEGYPTLYIHHNGGKTKWKYSKENNNWDEIPKITTVTDEEGNKIRKGAKARTEFFKKLLAEVQAKLAPLSVKENVVAKTPEVTKTPFTSDDLPF